MSTRPPGTGSASSVLGPLADPEDDVRPVAYPRRKLRKLLPYFRPYRGRALFTVFLMLVVTACGLAGPALAAFGIDSGIEAHDKGMLLLAVGLFVVVGLVGWGAGYLPSYLSTWVGERVLLDLRKSGEMYQMQKKWFGASFESMPQSIN